MKLNLLLAVVCVCLTVTLAQAAEEHAPAAAGGEGSAATQPAHQSTEEPHPALSQDPAWARKLVAICLGMFVAAIPIGILVRANMPEEVPLAAHDEHGPGEHTEHDTHGAPGHHGHGGGGHH